VRLLLEWYREARRAPEVIVVPDLPGLGADITLAHEKHVAEAVALTMKAITGFRPIVSVIRTPEQAAVDGCVAVTLSSPPPEEIESPAAMTSGSPGAPPVK
jgi:hypothetical protein